MELLPLCTYGKIDDSIGRLKKEMGRNTTQTRIRFIIFLLIAVFTASCGKGEGPWALSIRVDPQTAQVNAGETRTFAATVTGHRDSEVTWSVSEGPAGGTITDRGLYTAPLTPGIFHVVATSLTFPALSASSTVTVAFPSGALDPGFGNGGKVAVPFGASAQANALAIQSDGKIVAVGSPSNLSNANFDFVRLQTDGTLDPSFGTDGKQTADFSALNDFASAVVLQSDGKILAAGASTTLSDTDFALVRLNSDGTFDTTFDADGKVVTDFGDQEVALAIVVQPDQKIIAAGTSAPTPTSPHFALARYTSNGTLDPSFGTGGIAPTIAGNHTARAAVLQADGKIVVAGFSFDGEGNVFALARYNADGAVDSAFGGGSVVTTKMGSGNAQVLSLWIQSDGKILAAGSAFNGLDDDVALARYLSDGTLDAAFGTGGKVTADFDAVNTIIHSLSLQSDGGILIAGSASNGLNNDFVIGRYHPDGRVDSTFGTGGKVTTPIGSGNDAAMAIAPQGDGKIVAAGGTSAGADTVFSFARYWP